MMLNNQMEDKLAQSIIDIIESTLHNESIELHHAFKKIQSKISFIPSEYADLSTNLAIILSKISQKPLAEITTIIIPGIQNHQSVEAVSILNGFINIKLHKTVFIENFKALLENKFQYCYGKFLTPVDTSPINIEYVSANPTGQLHLGHGRVAVFADAMANIMQLSGYNVTREYYINDAGGQVNLLAESVYMRYKKLCGLDIDLANLTYPDDKLNDIAIEIHAKNGNKFIHVTDYINFFKSFSVDYIMKMIKQTLLEIGIKHDVFFSEKSLHDSGAINKVVSELEEKNLTTYEKMDSKISDKGTASNIELFVFQTKKFGDTQNRPLKKSNGDWTYFAADIAYHANKIARGFKKMINVWGADHDNHVKTMKAAVSALNSDAQLEVLTCQMLNLLESGKAVKMSKRAGNFVTISEIVDQVGLNTFRFMMLTKKPDTHFDFDMEAATKESTDNPVFYVNYAYARANSVINNAKDIFLSEIDYNITELEKKYMHFWNNTIDEEWHILHMIRECPIMFRNAVETRAPHKIITFLIDFAKAFHILWNRGKDNADSRLILDSSTQNFQDISIRRIKICQGIAIVIESLLMSIGITPTKKM